MEYEPRFTLYFTAYKGHTYGAFPWKPIGINVLTEEQVIPKGLLVLVQPGVKWQSRESELMLFF